MKTPILIAVTLLFGAAVHAQTTIYATNFESSQEFNPGPLPLAGPHWKQKGTQPFAISSKDGAPDDQIVECRSDASGASARLWLTGVDFPTGADKTVFTFMARVEKSGSPGFQGNVHIGNFPEAPGIKSDTMAAVLSFRGSGRICTFDGDTEIEVGNWKEGEWMPFRIELDSKAKTFSIYRDEELLAADYAFPDGKATPVCSFGLNYYSGKDALKESAIAIDSLQISHP